MNVILYRDLGDWKYEEQAAKDNFKVIKSRMDIEKGDLVIPRYSALPFYKELEGDVHSKGATLINSYKQHRYVADIGEWYPDLAGLTPPTWNARDLFRLPDKGPYVLKGATNSKKNWWSTMMYAETKRDAIDVHSRLTADGLIGDQEIYVREYVPLVRYFTGLQGQPITKEFRFFYCNGTQLCGGYYWSNYAEEIDPLPDPSEVPQNFLDEVVSKIKDNIRFFVLDVAQTEDGDWIVIELNDGQMSGISENKPNDLYKNLALSL